MPAMMPPRPTLRSPQFRAGGFSLLELSAAIGLLGILLVAGYLFLGATHTRGFDVDRRAQLAAAERAVAGFVELHGRLPCPDTAGNGFENCSAGVQKGWLPHASLAHAVPGQASLGLDASAPARGAVRMRYVVYRGTGGDLATSSDRFNPAKWDGERHAFGATNGLDFCSSLSGAAAAAADAGAAQIVSGGFTNIAFAIVEHGQDADGDGDPFDGALNGGTTARVESPARPADGGYDDMVLARGLAELSSLLACPETVRSVETLSRAADVAAEVRDQQIWAAVLAGVNTGVSAVKSGISALKMGLAIAATVTAAATLSAAITALSAAIAACAVIVGCALVPSLSAAVATGAAAVAAAATSIVLNGAALAANLTATGMSIAVTAKAGIAATPTTTDLARYLADMQAAAAQADAKALTAQSDATTARAAANTAKTTYDNNVTTLYSTAHGYDRAGNPRDTHLDTALADYRAYLEARATYEALKGAADNARKEANDTAAALNAPAFELPAGLPADVNTQVTSGDQFKQIQLDMQASLRTKAAELAAAATAAEQRASAALTTANTAWTKYSTSRDTAINAYKYSYSTTVDNKTTTTNVDGSAQVRTALDNTTRAYETYLASDRAATEKERAATSTRTSATNLQASVTNFQNELNKVPAGGTTPSAISVWQGAEAILRQADQSGTVK